MLKVDIEEIDALALRLAELLMHQGQTLAVAESCTGGWLAKILTDLPGSSGWFLGGVVSYSNAAKSNVLKVPRELIEEHGAVSKQVANVMAIGSQRVFSASVAISITGVAGPSGGTKEKPVGLVCFAVKNNQKGVFSVAEVFSGDRNAVRLQAVKRAILLIIDELSA